MNEKMKVEGEGGSMLYFLIDVLLLSAFFIYTGEQANKTKKSIDRFLDEANQAILLKHCYYDHSFRQEKLNQLGKVKQRLKYQMKEEIHKQIKLNIHLNDGGEHFLLWSFQYDQLEELQEKIINDEYVKELMILEPTERHLDDWDLF